MRHVASAIILVFLWVPFVSKAQVVVRSLPPEPPGPPPIDGAREVPNGIEAVLPEADGEGRPKILREPQLMFSPEVRSADRAPVYRLATGDSLRVDAGTPAGRYLLEDGRVVQIDPRPADQPDYPRYYGISELPKNRLSLRIRSDRQVGVLLFEGTVHESTACSDLDLLKRFASGLTEIRRGAKVVRGGPCPGDRITELDSGSYPRAAVEIPPGEGPIQVIFVAYGRAGSVAAPVSAFGQLRRTQTDLQNLAARPEAGRTAPEEIPSNGKVLLRISVDRATWQADIL